MVLYCSDAELSVRKAFLKGVSLPKCQGVPKGLTGCHGIICISIN